MPNSFGEREGAVGNALEFRPRAREAGDHLIERRDGQQTMTSAGFKTGARDGGDGADPRAVGVAKESDGLIDRSRDRTGLAPREREDRRCAFVVDRGPISPDLFEDRVEVTASEPERTHTCATRSQSAAKPRPRVLRHLEGTHSWREFVEGMVHLDRGREHFVVEREDRLHQACGPRGRLRVPDLRFHRAELAPRPVGTRGAEHCGEAAHFRRVPDRRPGSVRFDQFDRVGGDACILVRRLEATDLPFGARCVNRGPLSVGGASDSEELRVDRVAIPLGIREALQDDEADPFAEGRAIAIAIERAGVTARRQRGGLREAGVHEDVVEGVDPAGDHRVRPAALELHRGEVHRSERTRARRIDDAVGAAEVETVGDPAGDHVAEQARKGIFLPAHHAVGDLLDYRGSGFAIDSRCGERTPPSRVPEARSEGDDQLERAGHAE